MRRLAGNSMKTLVLLWGPFGHRADELAAAVGGDRMSITVFYGPRYLAPLRYLALALRTLILLSKEKPRFVYAQNPPVFCPLVCLLYCRLTGSRLIVDHHSIWKVKTLGRNPVSSAIGFLEAVVSRAAFANTTPHDLWADRLKGMGARRVEVIHDFVERNMYTRDDDLRRELAKEPVVAIASHGGHPLEMIEAEAAAIERINSVGLLICGPSEKLERRLSSRGLLKNVRYVGFLERTKYERLKASVDFAVNITDEPYTLSHVLFEYAAAALPVVTNRQEAVESVFGDSLLYTSTSSPKEVSEKVLLLMDPRTRHRYSDEMKNKYNELQALHRKEVARLKLLFS